MVGSTLQSLARDVDYYAAVAVTTHSRIVLHAAEYALVSAQSRAMPRRRLAHKNSSDAYYFNFANGTSGGGVYRVTPTTGSCSTVGNRSDRDRKYRYHRARTERHAATGSVNSLGLFTDAVGGQRQDSPTRSRSRTGHGNRHHRDVARSDRWREAQVRQRHRHAPRLLYGHRGRRHADRHQRRHATPIRSRPIPERPTPSR